MGRQVNEKMFPRDRGSMFARAALVLSRPQCSLWFTHLRLARWNMWLITLAVSVVLAAAISHFQYRQWSDSSEHEDSPQLRSFQLNYFVVYLLANGADWLQGPYVYALYEQYGHDKDAIAILFICGFFSSMLFGTFVGSLADI